MFFILKHVKMATNRRCSTDIQNEDEGENFLDQVGKKPINYLLLIRNSLMIFFLLNLCC